MKLSTDQVLKGLDELRNQALLCDVHLVAEGVKFPAHRAVLAAASPYFQAMFTGGFKENKMNDITLNCMSSEGLKCVLDAIYTGELSLTVENACDVVALASLLQLNEIVEHCGRFLTRNISTHTCLSFLSVAERYDLQEAVNECDKFALENFDTISQSMEFVNLSKEKLCKFLSDDQLKVHSGEIEVYRAILKWFEANRSGQGSYADASGLADLMQHVRFPLIPNDTLSEEILTNTLILNNVQVMKTVREAMRFHSNDNTFLQPLQEGKQFQPRGEQMLALIRSTVNRTGENPVVETKLHMIHVIGDNSFENEFSEEVLPMKLYPISLSLVTKGNYLFLFGIDVECWREIAVRLDVRKNTWLDLKYPPYRASQGRRATLLKGNIYLFGGLHVTRETAVGANAANTVDVNNISADAFKYSLDTNSWSILQNLPKRLVFHAAASQGNYVFCAGGFSVEANSRICSDKLYAYDIVGKIWLSKASMNISRNSLL